MMRKLCFSVCAIALFTASVFAADEPKKAAPSKEEQAQMEAMMKAATPGDMHKKLDGMVGTWDAKITMYGMPGQPPTMSTGTSENSWVLGGRWIEQKFSGNFMGMPFNGIGYTGYDNIKKTYVGTWMDNFSTSMMTSTGGPDADGKGGWTFTGTMDDPMTGKSMTLTEKVTMVDKDYHMWEMWGPGPDGKNMKMMEISYSRKK